MTAAWAIVEAKAPGVHCYGCGAHVINLLAADFRKIECVQSFRSEPENFSLLQISLDGSRVVGRDNKTAVW